MGVVLDAKVGSSCITGKYDPTLWCVVKVSTCGCFCFCFRAAGTDSDLKLFLRLFSFHDDLAQRKGNDEFGRDYRRAQNPFPVKRKRRSHYDDDDGSNKKVPTLFVHLTWKISQGFRLLLTSSPFRTMAMAHPQEKEKMASTPKTQFLRIDIRTYVY